MKKVLFAYIISLAASLLFAVDLRVVAADRDLGIPLEGVHLQLSGVGGTFETDANGIARIALPDQFQRGTLTAQFPGYAVIKTAITAGQKDIALAMFISDVLEGKELVVERSIPGKSDAQAGVSVVMDSKDMETTAQFGMVEDIMSAINTLPGVGFTGGWESQPSIRGGYPDEMGTVMDGVYILYPWHWGGAYSIFDPNMVSSAKMSNGIFSARYGRAMSGLLEVNTKTPSSPMVRVTAGISTISADLFAEVPFSETAGLFVGGKITYLESLKFLNDVVLDRSPKMSDTIPTMPYIRDFYAKGYFKPAPNLDVSINGFFGSDGIGVRQDETKDGIRTQGAFDWLNLQGFVATNIKWMPSERNVVHFVGGYNNQTIDAEFKSGQSGTYNFSPDFLSAYGALLGGATSYTINDLGFAGYSRQTIHQGQGKLETDILLSENNIVSFGTEEVFQFAQSKQKINGWQIVTSTDPAVPYDYINIASDTSVDGNRILNSALFALWAFGTQESAVHGELGLRGDHFYLWNDSFKLNTYPVADPRFTIAWTPVKNRLCLDGLTFTAGTGFFSMFPIDAIGADEQYDIKSFEVGPNRAWFQVLGTELDFSEGWSFRLEGYYKHYYNRLYLTGVLDGATGTMDYSAKTDGVGYATGFDLMLQKKDGRYFDGYMTYSFVVSKYKNPTAPQGDWTTTMYGEPLDQWYYPSFHRFHTLNLILNWKPVKGMVVTVKTSVATGTPRKKAGKIVMYPVAVKNGDGTTTIIEQYKRTEEYDSSLRNDISCPVDIRIGYARYFTNSKIRHEYYIGAENIFVNLYTPKTNSGFDPFTGKEIADSDKADYGIGIPQISLGYKISY